MATFTMVRKGFESVTFSFISVAITDTESGVADTEDIYTLTIGKGQNAISVKLDGKVGCEMVYHQYLAKGYKVVATPEPKVASPKKPKVEKPKVSREEALTKAYGSKEDRKAYIEAKKAFRRFYLNKGMKYGKEFDSTVKNALNKWNEAGRPAYNC